MMGELLKDVAKPQTRKYLYRLGAAVTLLLAGYGVIADEKVGLVNLVLSAVFAVADANVDPGEDA